MTAKRNSSLPQAWQLNGSKAALYTEAMSALVDVKHPTRGLTNLRIAGDAIDGWLFGVGVEADDAAKTSQDSPWQPADAYVRGCDLVATYREPLGQPFNLQVYWRLIDDDGADQIVLDAIVSVQTPLWEAYPCVTVASALAGAKSLVTEDSLAFNTANNWCYAEVTRPGDFTLSHVDASNALLASHWRFGKQFMERGVIRRLHLRGGFTRENDAKPFIARIREELRTEQPPLTA